MFSWKAICSRLSQAVSVLLKTIFTSHVRATGESRLLHVYTAQGATCRGLMNWFMSWGRRRSMTFQISTHRISAPPMPLLTAPRSMGLLAANVLSSWSKGPRMYHLPPLGNLWWYAAKDAFSVSAGVARLTYSSAAAHALQISATVASATRPCLMWRIPISWPHSSTISLSTRVTELGAESNEFVLRGAQGISFPRRMAFRRSSEALASRLPAIDEAHPPAGGFASLLQRKAFAQRELLKQTAEYALAASLTRGFAPREGDLGRHGACASQAGPRAHGLDRHDRRRHGRIRLTSA